MNLREIILHYKEVSEPCLDEICGSANIIDVEPGDVIVRQGELCNAFYINREGIFRVSHANNQTDNTILFGTEGDIYTSLHSYFANQPAAFSLVALEQGSVYELTYNTIRHLIAKYRDFADWMLYIATGQLYALERRYVKYATTTAEDRLYNFMANDEPYIKRVSAKLLTLRIPLKYIASYLQITPSTLSRLRRKLVGK